MARRPTINDVARRAGVSKGAVSYAFNGLPGVSEPTRQRILAAAEALGWQPSSTARALSGSRVGAIGLVLARPARTLGVEMFYMQFISGVELALSRRSMALVLQVVDDVAGEVAAYRRLAADHRVDGVLLTDLRSDDPRPAVLAELELPAVVVGGRGDLSGFPRVWSDDGAAMQAVVQYLMALGHKRIARVSGRPDFVHTQVRTAAFDAAADEAGVDAWSVSADFSAREGAEATRALLSRRQRPTALVYDNDVMAIAGCGVVREMGLEVPVDLSVVAWDDSILCELMHPPLTAVSRDVTAFGAHATEHLLAVLDGEEVEDREDAAPWLVPRASTGRPRATQAD